MSYSRIARITKEILYANLSCSDLEKFTGTLSRQPRSATEPAAQLKNPRATQCAWPVFEFSVPCLGGSSARLLITIVRWLLPTKHTFTPDLCSAKETSKLSPVKLYIVSSTDSKLDFGHF
jgi:hypothetical protein